MENRLKMGASDTHSSAHIRADVLHIGYPKAASTFIHRYLDGHPQVSTDHNRLATVLLSPPNAPPPAVVDKPWADKIHVSREESVVESVCVTGALESWTDNLYVPGGWDLVKNDIVVDPAEAARRLHTLHADARILLVIREQADWLQSAYKYVLSQLPAMRRAFADYCSTPSGIVHLQAGFFDKTIGIYADIFGSKRLKVMRFEDILNEPRRFTAELCAFLGVSERPISQVRENESNSQIARIQRLLPIVESLPAGVKSALKSRVLWLLPGARGAILSTRETQMLRGIYAPSNQRTEKLLRQLSTAA